jgi:hypothetical protein
MNAKHLLLLCLLAGSSQLSTAKTDDVSWLTVVGNAADPDINTILIDPTPVDVKGHLRWMTLRLNRAKQRTSTDGIVFRSFVSVIEFDCDKRTARFTKTQFYNGPLWTSPGRAMDYPASMVRPMVFREIEPNPSERVIKAACTSTEVLAVPASGSR